MHVSARATGKVQPPRISLLAALAVSLLAHGLLLVTLDLPRPAQAPRTALAVTLRTGTVERPSTAPPAVPVAARAPPPAAARPPQPLPPPPLPSAQEAPLAPATRPGAAPADTSFRPAEEMARAPLPEGNPELGELAPQLVGRRLRVSVWVDPFGTVQSAQVAPNELTPQQVELLERAIAQVHFAPARDGDDAAAAAVLSTLLCFDDAGGLDVASDECWKPQPAQGR